MLSSTRPAALALLFLAATACETRADQAAKLGLASRERVAAACSSDAGVAQACVHTACASACQGVAYDEPARACADACTGDGACTTDRDCAAPRTCVAIAPVVRRCTAP